MRYLITVSYDGIRYSGWQKQGNSDRTVSARLEGVLSRLSGAPAEVQGAGRTDAGVHALAQTATFDLIRDIDPDEILRSFNAYLPEDIAVRSCRRVTGRFHARLNAVGKVYRYTVRTAPIADVFARKYQWHLGRALNTDTMKRAAELLTGTHDYTSFSTKTSSRHSGVRTVSRIDINEGDGNVTLEFEGNGFLYNMVRIMTGTLCEIGLGERDWREIPEILTAKDRSRAGKTAPAQGLMLIKVIYPDETEE